MSTRQDARALRSSESRQLNLDHVVSYLWQGRAVVLTDDLVRGLLESYLHGAWVGKRTWSDTITPDMTPPYNSAEFGTRIPRAFINFLEQRYGVRVTADWQHQKINLWVEEIVAAWEG